MRIDFTSSRVLHVDMESGASRVISFGTRSAHLGGSGLAAALYTEYGLADAPADDPRQPLIFAIGPLTGFFPLMSKVVCGFRSPYTGEWSESHAGGRLALAMRFSGYDALMITGRARSLSCLVVGSRRVEMHDVHYMRGQDVFTAGKYMRRFGADRHGHRSSLRIGPAGENGLGYACINVDSFRHFGRMGSGAVMGGKKLKGIVVLGDGSFTLPEGKAYPALFKKIYSDVTGTDMMRKYHDLGTAENLLVLNELHALPWRNLQQTSDPQIDGISGERFAEQLLLRQTACAGCPVGCIHIGLLRQQFASDHEYLYKQVSYDYEPIFAQGSMLGITNASDVLALLDETEKVGLDCMSSGVALAWAAEALEKGVISEKETVVPLRFGDVHSFIAAMGHLVRGTNDFYRLLGQGAAKAAAEYGGEDFTCVLGQEMAGYATGEVFFVSQAMGFRHSHLDSGGYAYDQSAKDKDVDKAIDFLVDDEHKRVLINCMVSCMFARKAYTPERLQEALSSLGMTEAADALTDAGRMVQRERWRLKIATGYDVNAVRIPKRFKEVVTWKGPVDVAYMDALKQRYARAILDMAAAGGGEN
ncbi:Aldehyde ferredoxin oxidoreductase [Oleidesulfovibrio alaskensis G20]|jgi:aldehyde:ferredoxin oxidoreductase|uniref:Aldehyde ferredoxin oxidoreductase n=1 Tax=Oleidesulfovibrio alaskensis (strain ATCC BAA-1058 / DSM 17464 / G20) TaxID=207559 RepID=Q30X59_OLEA2|nr:aldehyde ferredoxin oxidoreductase N-terminal domain-containing protein [Oleidesulfovibrio alaskensis]ABB39737.1 Aldehyde ferredoxin oxidoreductase [Oleidesulfovibrio alaskensis G20]MBG0774693.1 aldehyde ferredoxin oxidoreductase [Oleidesulfovibrio alaskensis]MBL3582042.1 aldehyde ferredoxin oxidoreductase [Oleidesulfovibrio alaskensis]